MSGREICGDGTPEHVWDAWRGLHRLPVRTPQSLPGDRVVVIAPHPDDEVLGTGALLHDLHRIGREIVLIAVTDGEASHTRSARVSQKELACLRTTETATAFAALGLEHARTIRLGLPDGAVEQHRGMLQRALSELLEADDCVLVTARNDGHPDHEASAHATLHAAHERGGHVLEVPVWMWHWAHPGDARVAWHRARRILPATDAVAAKRRAVCAFASQTTSMLDAALPPVLSQGALARLLRPFEVVFT